MTRATDESRWRASGEVRAPSSTREREAIVRPDPPPPVLAGRIAARTSNRLRPDCGRLDAHRTARRGLGSGIEGVVMRGVTGAGHGTVREPRLEEVAAGVYAFVQPDGGWCLSNAGVVPGSQFTVVVDTAATIERTNLLRNEVDRLGHSSRRAVVNTHQHGDHTFGNCVFAPEALFIAHETARRDIVKSDLGLQQLWPAVRWGEVRLTPPQVTFTDRMTLHLGPGTAELFHPGPAHTTGDTVVWVPEQKVLFTGDIVMNGV